MFGNKQYPADLRYPTPENFPLERGCRTFSLPDDAAWYALLMGALMPLMDARNFVQFEGGITAEEAAEEFFSIMWDAWLGTGACEMLERPYWDDANADDAGDSETDGFPWYEDASDWIVAAFLASSGVGGAAFEFVTIARQFRLAFRKRDYGAIVRIFLDDVLQLELDTYSAVDTVEYVDIFTPAAYGFVALDDPTYTLRIEHTGTHNPAATPREGDYWLEAIRKRLWAGEIYPENLRYNPDCDCIQETFDGGETWVDKPLLDPRSAPQYMYPPVDSDDPRCQAAANFVRFINDMLDQVIAAISFASSAAGLLSLLIAIFVVLGPWAILITLVAALAAAMFDAGVFALTGAFNGDTYDALLCIYFCNASDDGTITPAQLAQIRIDTGDQLNTLANTIMQLVYDLAGYVGLSNMGSTGEAPADCDACDCVWRYVWDFSENDGGFVYDPDQSPWVQGTWVAGLGWRADAQGGSDGCGTIYDAAIKSQPFDIPSDCTITKFFAAATDGDGCSHMEMFVGSSRSAGLAPGRLKIYQNASSSAEATGAIVGAETGVHVGLECTYNVYPRYFGQAQLHGTGTPPDLTGGHFF